MDTNAFLLNRESLQARLENLRASIPHQMERKASWWMSLPLVPLAGFLAAKSLSPARHPMAKGFLLGAARRLLTSAARHWGLDRFMQPSLMSRIKSFL